MMSCTTDSTRRGSHSAVSPCGAPKLKRCPSERVRRRHESSDERDQVRALWTQLECAGRDRGGIDDLLEAALQVVGSAFNDLGQQGQALWLCLAFRREASHARGGSACPGERALELARALAEHL